MKTERTIKIYKSFEGQDDDLLNYHLSLTPLQRFIELRKMQAWYKKLKSVTQNEETSRTIVQKSLPEDWKRP